MKKTIWILSLVWAAMGFLIAQAPNTQTPTTKAPVPQVKAGGKQSPAAIDRPKTVTEQTYAPAQIEAGKSLFSAQCGFCHGRDSAGGERGPDLTRSKLVAEDVRGDKLAPLIRAGSGEMPDFKLNDADMGAIVAFIHDQKTKFETLVGARRNVEPADLRTGNAMDGKRFFEGAGNCIACHSPTGNLAGIASKFQGLALMQRFLNPPRTQRPKVIVTPAGGKALAGTLTSQDEWTLVIQDASGTPQTFDKKVISFKIDNPHDAHFDLLSKYTDKDMHDIYAYLETLK